MPVIAPVTILSTTEELRRHADRRLEFSTDRFQDRIRSIHLRLLDVNGPRGGVDKVCRVKVTLLHGPVLCAEAKRASFVKAITAATTRMRTLLARTAGGRDARRQRWMDFTEGMPDAR